MCPPHQVQAQGSSLQMALLPVGPLIEGQNGVSHLARPAGQIQSTQSSSAGFLRIMSRMFGKEA